ncbi:MAG: NAD-dependent epimerase/dehydratase family protein [Puniceicoccales bacterium]|jgi:UDP-glucose 4-epimerase|nr:NAD-dependent epimerase/dehydratase family protein [Puniceicoccales bacterium]
MRALVVGGAGYVGSAVVRHLLRSDWDVTVLDALYTGRRENLPGSVPFYRNDCGIVASVEDVLKSAAFDLVISSMALGGPARSLKFPLPYHHNNFLAHFYLLRALLAGRGVRKFLLLSDFSVYGSAVSCPIGPETEKRPDTPLGHSLCATENLLADLALASGLDFAVVRFGSAAGALPEGSAGPILPDGARRFPSAAFAVALGKEQSLPILGTTFSTVDGTALRDPIHVADVADAVEKAVGDLMRRSGGREFVLGSGRPVSVGEWLQTIKLVTQREIPTERTDPAPFDAPALYGDPADGASALGWRARRDIRQMVEDEWRLLKK